MSQTFTLIGDTSSLSENYYPPIELNKDFSYCLGLIGFHTYNTIPNIETGINDSFVYGEEKEIKIPEGSYEIIDIENYLHQQLIAIKGLSKEDDINSVLAIKPNNNTLKVEIKCKYVINFSGPTSIGKLLGYSKDTILKSDLLHCSNLPVDIIKVSSIRVDCNIVSGAYYGDKLSHTLFEFFPAVDPGFALNIEPHNIIYLPISTYFIDNISVKILDQNGNLINFRGEKIIVRLELKRFA